MQLSYVSLKLGHLPVTSVVQIRTSLLSATTVLTSAVCSHVVSLPTHGTHVLTSTPRQLLLSTTSCIFLQLQWHTLQQPTCPPTSVTPLSICHNCNYSTALVNTFVGKCMLQLLVCAVT